MRTFIFLAGSLLLTAWPAHAGPAEDATAKVRSILEKFNTGDAEAFYAAHRDDAVIVDEVAPYLWSGSGAARRWVEDYTRHAQANGVSAGRVDTYAPLQATSDGQSAYIVLPTHYSFLQNGRKMVGKGNMTFVMMRSGDDWKIASWTYSGAPAAGQ